MPESLTILYLLLFAIALLYASVGHGGASGYLAIMAIYGFSQEVMKPTALLLNLFVSLTAFIHFYRSGHFRVNIFLPLVLASIPMSFIGGLISIDDTIYRKILGILLLFPAARFFFTKDTPPEHMKAPVTIALVFIGAAIGLFSGMIGIGGGILLAPVLLLLKWANQKQTAAISALFIFVNSISGLGAQLISGVQFSEHMYGFVAVAFIGGLCGSWLGAIKFPSVILKNILAVLLVVAAWKLIVV